MGNLLDRYLAGECEAVWAELVAHGDSVRVEPHWSEALAVAEETMSRVLENLKMLHGRLKECDYPFICEEKASWAPLDPPPEDIEETIQDIEQKVGPMPLSVLTFAALVGSVDFRGGYREVKGYRRYHPDWKGVEYADPIVFWNLSDCFDSSYSSWLEYLEKDGPESAGPFQLEFAPDDYHKDDVSGGLPYGIILPNGTADAKVENEWHDTTFVNYLRECFKWGGFPGLARNQKIPGKTLAMLCRDLLPI